MKKQTWILMLAALVFSCSKFTYGVGSNDTTCLETVVASEDSSYVYKIMASRMVNALHYVWDADTAAHKVPCGEYYFAAFHAQDSVYEIEGLDDFMKDASVSMQEVYAVLPHVETATDDRMASYNPYASFVKPADGPLLCAFKRVSAQDSAQIVFLSPRSLTQRLDFRLKIRPKEGVEIKSVRAAISGVAGKVRLMSGLIRNDAANPTFRQYVYMAETASEGDVCTYEGSTSVLGLFAPSSREYTAGPGIFQVEISASVSEGGTMFDRVFYAGINMKEIIEKAALMEEARDRSGFRVLKSEALLVVPTTLEVGRDQVVSGEGDGLEEWFINDADIDIEI